MGDITKEDIIASRVLFLLVVLVGFLLHTLFTGVVERHKYGLTEEEISKEVFRSELFLDDYTYRQRFAEAYKKKKARVQQEEAIKKREREIQQQKKLDEFSQKLQEQLNDMKTSEGISKVKSFGGVMVALILGRYLYKYHKKRLKTYRASILEPKSIKGRADKNFNSER